MVLSRITAENFLKRVYIIVMKNSQDEVDIFIEKILKEEISKNDSDIFLSQMKEHFEAASQHLDALRKEVFQLKTIAEKANKYGAPGAEKLSPLSKFLDEIYSLKKFFQSR